jgi:Fe-S-cluster-containing dehydrogenase component
MAIDLNKCVGCGACALACKTENNTEYQRSGEKFNWADFYIHTEGTFAEGNFKYLVYPVLCNHCTDAPCVENCPATPKALYKSPEGLTLTIEKNCLGCKKCQRVCPYSEMKVLETDEQYSVISYNHWTVNTHAIWKEDSTSVITGGTTSPKETANIAGTIPPYMNDYSAETYSAVRPRDVVEKCTFCDHRRKKGEEPYCVVSCPAKARIFGDLDDSSSQINKVLALGYRKLKNNKGEFLMSGENGTRPNVFYIGNFGPVTAIKQIEIKQIELLKVFPNPADTHVTIETSITSNAKISIVIYDFSGRVVKYIVRDEYTPAGKAQFTANVSDLKTGTYFCTIQINGKKESIKLIVQH